MPIWLLTALAPLGKINWKVVWIGLGALLSAFLIWTYLDTRQANIELQGALAGAQQEIVQLHKEAKADDAAIATRNTLLTSLATMEVEDRAATVKALEANPNWANQPIPADVLASLRK